jgi:hypothetical protein
LDGFPVLSGQNLIFATAAPHTGTVPAKKIARAEKTPDFSVAFYAIIKGFLYFFLTHILFLYVGTTGFRNKNL